jgi:hypothetical protein
MSDAGATDQPTAEAERRNDKGQASASSVAACPCQCHLRLWRTKKRPMQCHSPRKCERRATVPFCSAVGGFARGHCTGRGEARLTVGGVFVLFPPRVSLMPDSFTPPVSCLCPFTPSSLSTSAVPIHWESFTATANSESTHSQSVESHFVSLLHSF